MSTSETEHPTIETLFGNLDRWRHFAGYPLEARVDALVGLFLPGVIEDCCELEVHSQVIPQFPLRKHNNNRSDKVDFFALSNDGGRAFLVEVKTDMDSREPRQYEYLRRARDMGMESILSDIKKIAQASKSRKKYFHLISALSELGLLELSNELEEMIRKGETRYSTKLISKIEVRAPTNLKPEVIYVQPREDKLDQQSDFKYIHFDKFADSIQKRGELGELLACYLRRWETDPGLCPPAKA